MKKLFNIEYWEVPHGGHIFAVPELFSTKLVESTIKDIDTSITSKKDGYGVVFKKLTKKEKENYKKLGFEFDYKASSQCFYTVKEAEIEKL